MENENESYWYALKCNGEYKPFLYKSKDCLMEDKICISEEECLALCEKLNNKEKLFNTLLKRLEKIREIINDPYKSPECAYIMVEETVHGMYD